jgi:hypothetical protein
MYDMDFALRVQEHMTRKFAHANANKVLRACQFIAGCDLPKDLPKLHEFLDDVSAAWVRIMDEGEKEAKESHHTLPEELAIR